MLLPASSSFTSLWSHFFPFLLPIFRRLSENIIVSYHFFIPVFVCIQFHSLFFFLFSRWCVGTPLSGHAATSRPRAGSPRRSWLECWKPGRAQPMGGQLSEWLSHSYSRNTWERRGLQRRTTMLCSDWLVVIRGGSTPIFMKDRGLVQR